MGLIDRVTILEHFPLIGSPYPKRFGVRKLVARPYYYFLWREAKRELCRDSAVLAWCSRRTAGLRINFYRASATRYRCKRVVSSGSSIWL